MRLVWGFMGSHYARFKNFLFPPRVVVAYLKGMAAGIRTRKEPAHYAGHNPAGAMMIYALLATIMMAAITGVMLYGVSEGMGPLSSLVLPDESPESEVLKDIHEFFANLSLILVFVHVGGVVLASWMQRQNLAKSMVTGLKKKHSDYVDVP